MKLLETHILYNQFNDDVMKLQQPEIKNSHVHGVLCHNMENLILIVPKTLYRFVIYI